MSETPFLGITEMEQGQSQAHIVHNEGIRAIERAAAGYLDKVITDNVIALTEEELQHSIIILSGNPVSTFEITIPTPLIRVWLIINTTAQAAVFVTSSASTITVPTNTISWLTCNGNLLTMVAGGSGDSSGGTGIAVWNSITTYTPGDIVVSSGTLYQCVTNNINRPVNNTLYWKVLILGGGGVEPPVTIDGSDLESDEYPLTIIGQEGVVNDTGSGERGKGIALNNGHIKFDSELTMYRNTDDGFLDIQRIGADYTILRIDAPPVELGSNESTLCLMCKPNTPDFTFMDVYNEEYSEERQCGIRVQRGRNTTLPYKPFVFDFNNTTPWRHKLRCFTCYITEGLVTSEVITRKEDPEISGIDATSITSVTELLSVVRVSDGKTYVKNVDYKLTYNWVDWRIGTDRPAIGEQYTVTYKYNRANFATQGNTVIENTLTLRWNNKDSVNFPSNQPGPIYPDEVTDVGIFAKKVANKVMPALAEVTWREKLLQTKLAYDRFVAYLPKSGPYDGTSLGTNFTRFGANLWHPFSNESFYASLHRSRIQSAEVAGSCAGIVADQPSFWRGNSGGRGGFFAVFRFGIAANWDGTSFFAGLAANTDPLNTAPSNLLNMIGIGFDNTDPATGNWYLMMNDGSGTATKIDTHCIRSNAQCLTLTMFCFPYHPIHNHWIGVTLTDENAQTNYIDSVTYSDNIPDFAVLMGPQVLAYNHGTTNAVCVDVMKLWVESDI